MKQKPIAIIRLRLLAGKAAPSPILGQALGQYGINIMDFCKSFNLQTKNFRETIVIPTIITIFNSNSFDISIKTPTTTFLVKNIVGFTKGSSLPKLKNLDKFIVLKEIYHIALLRKFNRLMLHMSPKSLCKSILGTLKSIGLPVKKNF